MNSLNLKEIKKNLAPLGKKFELILFGSKVSGGERPSSDIDIAIITHSDNLDYNIEIQKETLGVASLRYDIRVYELFPIYIQISIISNYIVLFGDPLEISEYFYSFRKKWDDCKHRILSNQFKHFRERLALIAKTTQIRNIH